MEKIYKCPICNTKLNNSILVTGPEITYTRKIKLGKSKISFCNNCNLGVNLSYKPFNFAEVKYNNIDSDFINDDNDGLLLCQFSAYIKNFFLNKRKNESMNCIELGTGERLSLLTLIASELNINSYAVDPIFLENRNYKNIKLLKNISELNASIKPSIFIARNCLEYFSPISIIEMFNHKLNNNVLILIELQSFDQKKWGDIFYFREYQYFYSKLSLEKLFLKEGFNIQWLSSFSKHGEARRSYFAYISRNPNKYKIIRHKDINGLVNYLKGINGNKKIYLWGAGGRGLNFIYNEGKGIINTVIDSSENRQGIILKGYGKVIAPDLSIKNSIIILLNSNFMSYIPSILKKQNTILLIS